MGWTISGSVGISVLLLIARVVTGSSWSMVGLALWCTVIHMIGMAIYVIPMYAACYGICVQNSVTRYYVWLDMTGYVLWHHVPYLCMRTAVEPSDTCSLTLDCNTHGWVTFDCISMSGFFMWVTTTLMLLMDTLCCWLHGYIYANFRYERAATYDWN